jgi:hypothetical protein
MSSGPKYGHLTGDGNSGRRMALTNGEYFNEKGGHFVKRGSAGAASLATSSSDYLIGWAEVGKLTGYGANYFSAVTTSDAFVIEAGAEDTYRVPAKNAVTAAQIGYRFNVTYTGSTTTLIQQVDNDGTDYATGQLFVVGVDTEDVANQTLQVKLLAAKAAS